MFKNKTPVFVMSDVLILFLLSPGFFSEVYLYMQLLHYLYEGKLTFHSLNLDL